MLRYVTTNPGKVREAREYLGDAVDRLDYDYAEIQADDLGPIAARGARDAHRHAGEPVIVDDAGLFVDGLDGFPGPYSSFVEGTIGVDAVWRLCDRECEEAGARFRCVLAYCDGEPVDDPAGGDGAPVRLFEGVVEGEIVPPRGDGGFGYDPIFEYDGRTFAEIDPATKNEVSHRGRALDRFAEWYGDR